MRSAVHSSAVRVILDAIVLVGLIVFLGAICILDDVQIESRLARLDRIDREHLADNDAAEQPSLTRAGEGSPSGEEPFQQSARGDSDSKSLEQLPPSSTTVAARKALERLGMVERETVERDVAERSQPSGVVEKPMPSPVIERPKEVVAPQPVVPEVAPRKESMEVEFFQTRTRAKTIAFVVDCSGSMSGNKYDQVRAEMIRSISELEAKQAFYVALFNDAFIPMFSGNARPKMETATPATTTRVFEWLKQSGPGGGTDPQPALLAVADLKPDVIYLLTDGNFSSLRPETFAVLNANSIVVHTIGFGSEADSTSLKDIAMRTGGTFRAVDPNKPGNPAMANANPQVVRAALKSPDTLQQIAAIEAIETRRLPFESEVIEILTSPNLSVRKAVHRFLSRRSQHLDLGPKDLHDRAAIEIAQRYWRQWAVLRKANLVQLTAACRSPVEDQRVVAAALAARSSPEITTVLIPMLRDATADVRREAHKSLVTLSSGVDHGPPDGAGLDETTKAASRWSDWWDRRLREKAEVNAAEVLRVAKTLLENGSKDEAKRRLKSIADNFPDTLAADEAKRLLSQSQ